jgi:hypothetical protein
MAKTIQKPAAAAAPQPAATTTTTVRKSGVSGHKKQLTGRQKAAIFLVTRRRFSSI